MLPRILLALMLTAPLASAQHATIGPNSQIAPAGSTVIVVGNGTGPLLSTPIMTFGTAAGTAGISLVDRAGISNTAPAPSAVPSGSESFPVYGNTNLPNAGAQPGGGESAAALPAPNNTGRLINDVGPSYYAGAGFASGSPAGLAGNAAGSMAPASLGDIAAKYKSSRPQNIRVYTNADAQRLSDTINVHGANLNPVSAQAAPPTPAQTQVAQTQTYSGVTVPPAAPQVSASARPSPAIREEATQNTQSSATVSDREQGATTPQTSQTSSSAQNNNDQEAGNRLPASSTLLPLFGLLGIASGAMGVWLARYRR